MNMKKRFVIVYVLLMLAGLFITLHADVAVPVNRPLVEFPRRNGEWLMASEAVFSKQVLAVLRPTDYLSRRYMNADGKNVELYIGYHGGGKESGQIHSPKQCLPGSGWFRVSEVKETVEAGGKKINLVKAVYQKGDEKDLFIYWYEVNGRTISGEYSLKAAEIMNSVFNNRRDSAFIRVSVPFEANEEKAFATGVKFVRDFYPLVDEFLPG